MTFLLRNNYILFILFSFVLVLFQVFLVSLWRAVQFGFYSVVHTLAGVSVIPRPEVGLMEKAVATQEVIVSGASVV